MSYACLSLSDVLCDCALHSLVFHPVLPAVTQRSETVGCLQGKILKASRFPPGAPSRIKKHLTTPPPTLIFLPQREVVVSLGGGLFRHHFHSHSSKRSTLRELVRTSRGAEITLRGYSGCSSRPQTAPPDGFKKVEGG